MWPSQFVPDFDNGTKPQGELRVKSEVLMEKGEELGEQEEEGNKDDG